MKLSSDVTRKKMRAVILMHVNATRQRDGIISLDSKLGIIPVDFNKSVT
jgi:hypothetical protein